MNTQYKYGIKHYTNLLLTNIFIQLKAMYEYKANFYSSIFKNFSLIILHLFFLNIISKTTQGATNWIYQDYVIFFLFIGFTIGLSYTLSGNKYLDNDIKRGLLNKILLRPGNRVLNYITYLEESSLIYLSVYTFILAPYVLITSNYNIVSLVLSIIICIILSILFTLIYIFITSFSFYFLELGSTLVSSFDKVSMTLEIFPGIFWENTKLRYLIGIVPFYFVATIIVPLFQNKNIINLEEQVLIIIILFIISIIGIIINWKYGLKRYSAYG